MLPGEIDSETSCGGAVSDWAEAGIDEAATTPRLDSTTSNNRTVRPILALGDAVGVDGDEVRVRVSSTVLNHCDPPNESTPR